MDRDDKYYFIDDNGELEEEIFCRFCRKNITKLIGNYSTCNICRKSILFECDFCHRTIVHKDYEPPKSEKNDNRIDFTQNSYAEDLVKGMKRQERDGYGYWDDY